MAREILARCDELAGLSSMIGGICRTYLSPEHRAANSLVGGWMRSAGMEVVEDAVGNICGRFAPAGQTRFLVIGSHLDTVPDAGRYDGILGVLTGIALVQSLGARGHSLPFGIEVVGFGEEEGVRFGATLMGSRGYAGSWDPAWAQLLDADGVSLADAMSVFGLDIASVDEAARAPETLLGYLELHIEQGPVLEAENLPVGVVTGIAGARRLQVEIEGQAAHAGTTPMRLRRDALVTAAACVQAVAAVANALDIVATVGQLSVEPGGVNVVPGCVTFSVDVRSTDQSLLDEGVDRIVRDIEQLAQADGLRFDVKETHRASPATCAPMMVDAATRAIEGLGLPAFALPSGAGHDAMAIAPVCDVGMIFVRCAAGLSHNPDESISVEDAAWGLAAMRGTVLELAAAAPDFI